MRETPIPSLRLFNRSQRETNMSVKMRQEVERKVVGAFVDSALKAGHRLSVSLERGYDIEECLLGSTDREKIMEEAFAGDVCHIFVHETEGPLLEGTVIKSIGWVYCVFGNDGWDVICYYTTNLDGLGLMKEASRISDEYQ